MEFSIIRRLETVEDEILAAVASDGSSALVVFTEKWTTLLRDISQASQAGHLSCETQALVFQTASMVNTLAESFVEFEQTHIALSVQFRGDRMQEIYAQVCLFLGLSKTLRYLPPPHWLPILLTLITISPTALHDLPAPHISRLPTNGSKTTSANPIHHKQILALFLWTQGHLRNDSVIGSSLRANG